MIYDWQSFFIKWQQEFHEINMKFHARMWQPSDPSFLIEKNSQVPEEVIRLEEIIGQLLPPSYTVV